MEREEMALNTVTTNDTLNDENVVHSVQKQKLSSQVEQPSYQNNDDREEYSKAARSSENSKARSGSSKDYRKSRDPVEEEVVQGGRSTRTRIIKRPVGENEDIGQRKDRDERQEIEKHHVTVKGREDSYSRKNWDPNLVHPLHVKTETIDRRKESDTSEVAWQRRGEDPHGKRTRPEDTRKREHSEEMGSRHRSKVRENERSDRDDHHQLRNYFDNGSWRAHDKDMGSRYRDRDDNLKSRSENMDDLHIKRRKDETQSRRDNAEKDVLHIHRENSSRRKRERDDVLDQRKRDDQARFRDDDQHQARHKEEGFFQRERGERQREHDEWHRLKQSHEESLSKRERDGGRGDLRSGRNTEDKAWAANSRAKDDYKGSDREYLKDAGRHVEQLKRRDRVENESFSMHRGREDAYTRGNQLTNDGKRARHERASSRNDRAVNASDNHRVHEKRQKENIRKGRELEDGDHISLTPSKRNQEEHNGQISETVCYFSGYK
ncbi:unnamed protein product [Ilex paraguariensis]|uniref:Uncharacterized protein n=1 Tax=Ilex paraguariensis TaxID=185542 RepID=A0ABC8TGI0_9AQUA